MVSLHFSSRQECIHLAHYHRVPTLSIMLLKARPRQNKLWPFSPPGFTDFSHSQKQKKPSCWKLNLLKQATGSLVEIAQRVSIPRGFWDRWQDRGNIFLCHLIAQIHLPAPSRGSTLQTDYFTYRYIKYTM